MVQAGKKSLVPLLILAAAVALWLFDNYREAAPTAPASGETGGRYEVYHGCTLADDRGNDGDSFRVKLPGGRTEIIRLYFVDAPESAFKSYGGGRNNHMRIAEQAEDLGGLSSAEAVEIGKKAKSFTLSLLTTRTFTIHTEWDDPFGDRRYHAFIEVDQGGKKRFLHELLVEEGLARIHTKGAPLPDGTPERKHEDRLYKLQSIAKANESGAWAQ